MIVDHIEKKEPAWKEDKRVRKHVLRGNYKNANRLQSYYEKRDRYLGSWVPSILMEQAA